MSCSEEAEAEEADGGWLTSAFSVKLWVPCISFFEMWVHSMLAFPA
jgi:hypothetical protein